jgi:NADPH-dependent curcumin reductase CurA
MTTPIKLTVDDIVVAAGCAYAAHAGSVDAKAIDAAVKEVLRFTGMVIVDGRISHLGHLDTMRENERLKLDYDMAMLTIQGLLQSNKESETKPMYDREGNYLGEWNGKVTTGAQYRTKTTD